MNDRDDAASDAGSRELAAEDRSRTRIRAEIWIVLGLSLGQSAVYAVVSLIGKLTEGPLRDQTATLNASESTREYLDLTYQVLGIAFALVPVALALYLLSANGRSALRTLGLDRTRPWFDVGAGVGLAALIGLPGLAFYFIGRELGMTATVVPSALNEYWWTVPVLILSAMQNAVLEEVVVVGYLMTRLRDLGWELPATLATSALVRGSYHLYQGVGPGIGNAVMGVIFGYWYYRTGRVMPLIIAHTILDIVAFVGYALLKDPLGLP
ncbi:CPBP family intramembrane glutamic endopeptidase [Solicola gregarius]|uniref:CPBP family intramembrane metalloprotease n=1 Tax=Solicola gregarius TaxID=2908642 RepID=A0AA46YKY4_9ACTN|nr:CPBP family intramembrane glutamic endopeptidase [Solicola gregarius]UYM04991.1 CPBP family intramembrane metalloprotease [Solicola gregarius]